MMSNNAGPTKKTQRFYDSKMTYKTEELSKSTWMRFKSGLEIVVIECFNNCGLQSTYTTPSHLLIYQMGLDKRPCRYMFFKKLFI